MNAEASDLSREDLRKLRHDLRSPLMIISGFARLLGSDKEMTPEQRADFTARIDRAVEEIRRTLDETIG